MRILQKFYQYICFSGPDQYLSKKYHLKTQKKILNKLLSKCKHADTLSDIQRSYLQYRATVCFYRKLTVVLLNVVSIGLLIYYLIYYGYKGLIVENQNDYADGAVLIPKHWPYLVSMLPQAELANKATKYISQQGTLNFSALSFYWAVFKKYPLSFYFHVKNIRHLAKYNYNIAMSKPSAMIVCWEYSFASSVMTKYCESLGVSHINVMHGHKFFVIQDSFFRFTKCYVWDQFYKDLFISMYAQPDQFVVWDLFKHIAKRPVAHKWVKIYLGGGEDEARVIRAVRKLKAAGCSNIVVRAHPAYPINMDIILNEGDVIFEDPKSMPILDSLGEASMVIGEVTTCLVFAKFLGASVVVNDLDYALCNRYEMLKGLDILRPYRVLSNL